MSKLEPIQGLKLGGLQAHPGPGSEGQALAQVQSQLQASTGLGQALLGTLDQIVARVLGQQPVDSKGNPTGQVLYMQMTTGLPIDPRQYANMWTPAGGKSLQTTLQSGQQAPASASTSSDSAAGASSTTASSTPQVDPGLGASMEAAFQTSLLVDELYEVTGTGELTTYPSSRSLSFQYESVIKGMQPANPASPSKDVVDRVNAARQKLYQFDSNGNITGPTQLYQNYQNNQMAWVTAKANMAGAQAEAMTNPALGSVWPQMSASYQAQVDQAYDNWMAEGAQDVEQALAEIESEGMDTVDVMVADARKLYDAWNLGIAGVPSPVALSMISPTTWYDPTDKNIGFSSLSVTSSQFSNSGSSNTKSFAQNWYQSQSSKTGGGGSAGIFGVSLSANAAKSSSSQASGQSSSGSQGSSSQDQTTNVSIDLEWGLCRVQRPWLVSDLFHVGGWYMVNQKKNTISDGTIQGQVNNQQQILPMIPTAFLVIRNVKITASNWGQTGTALAAASQQSGSSGQSSSTDWGGSVGFLGFGAQASHSQVAASGGANSSASTNVGWSFSGGAMQGTLSIEGGQIIGWVGEIVPACPPVDDPTLQNQTTSPSSAGAASASGSSSGSAGS